MALFAGLDRTDYQDLLRALGARLDAERWRDLRLVEDDAGFILQVRQADQLDRGFLTYRLTEDDCLAVLRAAYAQRGLTPLAPAAPAGVTLAGAAAARAPGFLPAAELGYEPTLRGVGRLLDAAGWRGVRLIELPGALLVQGKPGGSALRRPATWVLTPEGFRSQLAALGAAAGAGERGA